MENKTALEWLFEKMAQTPMTNWYEIREQAKQMQNKQIIDACLHTASRFCDLKSHIDILNGEKKLAEQYYNETYNK